MAFPTVDARTSSEQATNASSFTVELGSPTAGELIVAIISIDTLASVSTTWEIDKSVSGNDWWAAAVLGSTSSVVGMVAIKVATGSDALKIAYGNGDSEQASAITFRISGHGGYAAVSSAAGNSTNGDPPNVAISGSAQDCLFIAALCTDAQVVASAAPSSYGNLTTKTATNSGGVSVSVADRNLNATSDNPGVFTNTTEQWVAFTIAIPESAITTNMRATQVPIEVVSKVDPNLVATQLSLDIVNAVSPNLVATQLYLEVVSSNDLPMALVATEGEDTGSASVTHGVVASLATTEGSDALVALAQFIPNVASLAVTELADTGSVSAQLLSYIVVLTSIASSGDRITAIPDLEVGWWLEVGPVVTGGTIIDVVVNQDATFEVDADVTSFEVRAWDGSSWGAYGTQYIFDPGEATLVVTEGSDTFAAAAESIVQVSLAVTEGSDTISIDAEADIEVSLVVTEAIDTAAATVSVEAAGISAMFAVF